MNGKSSGNTGSREWTPSAENVLAASCKCAPGSIGGNAPRLAALAPFSDKKEWNRDCRLLPEGGFCFSEFPGSDAYPAAFRPNAVMAQLKLLDINGGNAK